MHQLLLGAAIPYAVGLVLYLRRHGRASLRLLLWGPGFMVCGALWAVAPDIPRFFGLYALYNKLAADPRTDFFLMHYTIDRIEHDSILFTVLFVLMTLSLIAAAWRELLLRERCP